MQEIKCLIPKKIPGGGQPDRHLVYPTPSVEIDLRPCVSTTFQNKVTPLLKPLHLVCQTTNAVCKVDPFSLVILKKWPLGKAS